MDLARTTEAQIRAVGAELDRLEHGVRAVRYRWQEVGFFLWLLLFFFLGHALPFPYLAGLFIGTTLALWGASEGFARQLVRGARRRIRLQVRALPPSQAAAMLRLLRTESQRSEDHDLLDPLLRELASSNEVAPAAPPGGRGSELGQGE